MGLEVTQTLARTYTTPPEDVPETRRDPEHPWDAMNVIAETDSYQVPTDVF